MAVAGNSMDCHDSVWKSKKCRSLNLRATRKWEMEKNKMNKSLGAHHHAYDRSPTYHLESRMDS
jgi:hypothetical protein